MNGLTGEMMAAARATPSGQYLDRLIREDFAKGGSPDNPGTMILQELWDAMKAAAPMSEAKMFARAVMEAAGQSCPTFLTSSTAKITIVGNTPTTGGAT